VIDPLLTETADAQLESNQGFAQLGFSVAGAGDVNGDGYADVIVGAFQYDADQTDEGAAFVFLGNSAGRPVRAHQERGNASGIAVQPWGASHSATGFTVELTASHPAGTGRVKAELEACPPGVAFGNGSCTSALTPTWLAVNGATPEVSISHTFTGLSNNTLYHWRARILHAPETGAIPTRRTARGGGSARNRWRRTSACPSPPSCSRWRAAPRCSPR